MIVRNLQEVERMSLGNSLEEQYQELIIKGISTDTRTMSKDNLFIPLIGENFNGHEFIDSAIAKGAIAALWDEDQDLPDLDFPFILVKDTLTALQNLAKSYLKEVGAKVIGITGSNGKTSSKDIVASLLKTQYRTHKTQANFNNAIGVPLTILSMDEDIEMLVLEMGMDNFGQIELLTKIAPPDAALITNIGKAHLEGLKVPENIAKAKLEILKGLRPGNLFLYYGDDPILSSEIKNIQTDNEIKTYGFGSSNDYQPEIVTVNKDGCKFYLKEPRSEELYLPMLGRHQVLNATAAIALASYFGISADNIKKGLLDVEKTGMRNELIQGSKFSILDDSYKSNPASLRAALDTLYSIDGYDYKVAVLGDMLGLGEDEISMHREIGSELRIDDLDYLFTLGKFGEYISQAARENFPEDRVFHFQNKEVLVEKIKELVKANSLVLVKASRPLAMEEVVEKLKN